MGGAMTESQGAPQSHVYKTAGCEIRLDAYPAQAAAPAPVVVWVHGVAH
jgi:hypothetical protein